MFVNVTLSDRISWADFSSLYAFNRVCKWTRKCHILTRFGEKIPMRVYNIDAGSCYVKCKAAYWVVCLITFMYTYSLAHLLCDKDHYFRAYLLGLLAYLLYTFNILCIAVHQCNGWKLRYYNTTAAGSNDTYTSQLDLMPPVATSHAVDVSPPPVTPLLLVQPILLAPLWFHPPVASPDTPMLPMSLLLLLPCCCCCCCCCCCPCNPCCCCPWCQCCCCCCCPCCCYPSSPCC